MSARPPTRTNWSRVKMNRARTTSTPAIISPAIVATYHVGDGSPWWAAVAGLVGRVAEVCFGLRLFDSGTFEFRSRTANLVDFAGPVSSRASPEA